ncbi:hypothetical protein [Romboutsia sp.]|uniref:hypothetical protein n=1 Tax=Romboutsia sp. TaxID=1965302 RepID=UPI002C3B647E|nr:hypothetical protein [Romboutsia sp.]HSQ89372.1 hypothetical protein [Romboutsia sp.]
MSKLSKVEERLNEVQKRCNARLLDMKDVQIIISEFEKTTVELIKNGVESKDIELVYQDGEMKKGYGYENTSMSATLLKSGKVDLDSISFIRQKCSYPLNRIILTKWDYDKARIALLREKAYTQLEKKLLKKVFNVNNNGYINIK